MEWDDADYQSANPAQRAIMRAISDVDVEALRDALQSHGDAVLRAPIESWMPIIDEVMVEAVFGDNRAPLSLLLDAGLDPDFVKDEAPGRTLLMQAAMSDPVTCRLLLDRGANPARHDRNGHTALFYAADLAQAFFDEESATSVATMLRAAGASVDVVDRWGKRAIHYAEESTPTSKASDETFDRFIGAFR